MVGLSAIAAAPMAARLHPLAQLGPSHGLTRSDLRMLGRFFGLSSVALHPQSHARMNASVLSALLDLAPDLRGQKGLVIHAKTQTHNTLCEDLWLPDLVSRLGLADWELTTVSMAHCAGALTALHLTASMATDGPVILLTGEKCFHRSTARQSGAALGELPAAALITPSAEWRVVATHVSHAPAYFDNPDRMDPALLRRFGQAFGPMFTGFVNDVLDRAGLTAAEVDLIVPYNLNLPVLRDIAEQHGWQERMFLRSAPHTGHLFCSDVLINLGLTLPQTGARTVLCLAAGMGATFAATVLRKGPGTAFRSSSFAFEDAQTGTPIHIPLTPEQETAA